MTQAANYTNVADASFGSQTMAAIGWVQDVNQATNYNRGNTTNASFGIWGARPWLWEPEHGSQWMRPGCNLTANYYHQGYITESGFWNQTTAVNGYDGYNRWYNYQGYAVADQGWYDGYNQSVTYVFVQAVEPVAPLPRPVQPLAPPLPLGQSEAGQQALVKAQEDL